MSSDAKIRIDLATQTLTLAQRELPSVSYPVSTALKGAGQQEGSLCTPLGRHVLRACIGAGQPVGAVFVGRRPTGEICDARAVRADSGRDWILTRILWLSGTEPGRNRSGAVDSMRRFIYIHGTPDEVPLGVPLSHGCIRMRNAQIIDLFDRVSPGTTVEIVAGDQA